MKDNPLKPSVDALERAGATKPYAGTLTLESFKQWLSDEKKAFDARICPEPAHISKLLPILPNSIGLNHQEQSEPF